MTDSTLAGNLATHGGAIANLQGTLTLADTTLSGNTGTNGGGGIYSVNGSVAAINTTLSGNLAASQLGGGIESFSADVSLIDSTVSGNSAPGGGGIFSTGGGSALALNNSIVAGNAGGPGNDVYSQGIVTLEGHSILGSAASGGPFDTTNGSYTQIDGTSQTDLQTVFAQVGNDPHTGVLSGVLANNGGGVDTIALNPTGIAIDTGISGDRPQDTLDLNHNGDTAELLPVDARGAARVVGTSVDVGAFEQQAAQTFVVTTLDDELDSTNPTATIADMGGPNDLSLREALFLASEDPTTADTITFANNLSGGTLTLTSGQLDITSNVTIEGDIDHNGTADITISGGGSSGILDVGAGITADFDGLVITDGNAVRGGGLYVDSSANVTVTDSTFSGNSASYGGAIFSASATLTLANSTLSGNVAGVSGGAIDAESGSITAINTTLSGNSAQSYDGGGIAGEFTDIHLISSTVSGNAAAALGGGLRIGGGSLILNNSIVAGNMAVVGSDFSGGGHTTFSVEGNNIVGSAPEGDSFDTTNGSYTTIDGTSQTDLQTVFAQVGNDPNTGVLSGVLASNGGGVQTIALNPTGIAIDTGVSADRPQDTLDLNHNGDTAELLPVDARGAQRVSSGGMDIGAFEQQAVPANLVVTTLDDETYDGGDIVAETADGNGLSLREALGLANGAGGSHTITFAPSLSGGTLTLALGQLVTSSDVTIDGDIDGNGTPDITIDGNYASRVFAAQAGNATLDGLGITHGSADLGGGLRIYGGASVDVTNSYIGHNSASNSGGGVYVAANGVLALNSSEVGRNTADYGGGIDIASGSATINNSNIYLNTGSSDGGGIWANIATVALTNATVADNTAYGSGGGIHFTGNHGVLTLTNATLSGNYSAAEGGAVFVSQAAALLTNSTLTGNYGATGGGIYANQADVTLGNSIVAGNQAYASAADLSDSSPAFSDLHFLGHNITGSAPDFATVDTSNGSYTQIDGASQTDLQKVFAQVGHDPNTGVLSGVLANNGGQVATVALNPTGIAIDTGVTADAVYDADNNPGTPDVPIPTDARGFSRDVGSSVDLGAFEQQAPQSFVVTTLDDELDSTDPHATIADMGGANDLSLREALFLANEDPTTADTITFANDLSGGTIDLTLGQLKLTGGVTIDGGNNDITVDAQGYSRVFDALYGASTINGLTITGGYAGIGGAVKVGSSYGCGGGIAVNDGSSLHLTNSIVSGNNAYLVGGGIANQGTLTLTNSTVSGNSSGYLGGGIASDNTLTIIGSTLSNNQTGGLGPGLPLGYHYGGGGGIYNSGSATLINTTISGNKGGSGGGGIYNSEALTLTNVTLADNSAYNGGGLSNAACGCGNVTIDDTTITGNAATAYGGGIANAAGSVTLANSIVGGNGASSGPDIAGAAYGTITYSGVNLFSQYGIGRAGTDIYISPSDLAQVFDTLTTIDPDGLPNSGDEFLAGTLANNGGPVETVLIKERGAAQNTGDNTALPVDPANPDQLLPADARGETRVFDGTVDLGALELQILLTPVVTAAASNINASASENFTPAQLFSASTSVGDPIVSYEVQDETSGPNNGFWVLNGAVLPNGQITTLSAAQLAELSFVAGSDSAPVVDTLEGAASNAGGFGAFTTFTVTAAAHGAAAPPVVTAANELQPPDLTLAASSLFSATASPGNSIASYEVEDTTPNSGHWMFNGVTEPANQLVFVTAAQLSQLNFVTGYGTDSLMVRVNDGSQWGNFTTFTVTPPPNPAAPAGTSSEMITVRGSDGAYEIYDLGDNTVLAPHPLTQIDPSSHAVGLGNFNGTDTTDLAVRNGASFQYYDVANNNVTQTGVMGTVGTEWSVVGSGKFDSTSFTDLMMQRTVGGVVSYDAFIVRNNQFVAANPIAAVGSDWQTVGFGDVNGDGTKDMVLRNTSTGTLEYYDIANGQMSSAGVLGTVGTDWQPIGFGTFDNSGFSDLIMRNSSTNAYDLFEIRNNQIVGAHQIAAVGAEWQLAGFADANGDGTDDMLLRNSQSGLFEFYDISNGVVTSTASLGAAGPEWQVIGIAPFQAASAAPVASDPMLSQGSASATSDPLGAGDWVTQAMQASGAANQASLGEAGLGTGASPVPGTSSVSGPGFDAGSDLLAGAAPAASLTTPNPLQPHTG